MLSLNISSRLFDVSRCFGLSFSRGILRNFAFCPALPGCSDLGCFSERPSEEWVWRVCAGHIYKLSRLEGRHCLWALWWGEKIQSLRATLGQLGQLFLGDTVSQGIGQDRHLLSVPKYDMYPNCHILRNQAKEGYRLQEFQACEKPPFLNNTSLGYLGQQAVKGNYLQRVYWSILERCSL